ncbi:MAG: phosphate/phosphite/phosphonate ABC transporter substrate-binding protein [Desulfuromonadales bacterium]|nr:phosphate/phosphite/phosphonate ABC transporter substrate-binding protein [Desulfuromonadales bacterium]
MNRFHFLIAVLLGLLLFATGCENEPKPVAVDLTRQSPVTAATAASVNTETLRLGIGSMITPKDGYIYYRRLTDYLETRLERPVTIVDRGTYREFNDLLASGGLDLAFVCGGPYVEGHADFDLKLLVVPQTPGGETVYYSYLIVPATSSARSFGDLRGGKFAFTDPQSNTGYLVPNYMLARLEETPDNFFGEIIYTYAHDKSIHAVAAGKVDGAAVDSLIYDYLAKVNPELVAKIRILSRSHPYGIPPVVVRPDLPEDEQSRLRQIFLTMHDDPEGQSILAGMMIGRFVVSDDASYDGIREIEAFIRRSKNTGR